MVLDATSIWVYTFTGRLHLNPRYPGSQAQIPLLTWKGLSLGLDVLAIRDNSDNTGKYGYGLDCLKYIYVRFIFIKVLHIFDLIPGASRQYEPHSLRAKTQISEISACRAGTVDDQFVVFIDTNRELYITETRNLNGGEHDGEIYKIGTQVTAVKWASETNILVGVHDACYSIWYCPGEGANDPTIIALTTVTIDTA